MLIARKKRRENIAEYILYMWQLEDLIRANGFSPALIREQLIDPFDVDARVKEEMEDWYGQLIQQMKQEKIEESGHCRFLVNLVNDLHDFHLYLLTRPEESAYQNLYKLALPFIRELEQRSLKQYLNETDTCLHGLYGLLLLKLQKKKIHPDTTEAFQHISQMIAYLSARYLAEEEKK